MSEQTRILLALALCMAIPIVWNVVFPPPKLQPPAAQVSAGKDAGTPTTSSTPASAQGQAAAPASTPGTAKQSAQLNATAAPQVRVAEAERTIVVENDVYRIEFSNRGGVVRSWKLKKYLNSAEKQETLDVVDPVAAPQVGAWPLSFLLEEKPLEYQLNAVLFTATPAESPLHTPGEITFEWS
ncbi:MAG: membrane protein insertase YidC, partial [Acidobacteria bacterium]|nr:membrane protein insertase YidC [Acidobacteriota bacterium]